MANYFLLWKEVKKIGNRKFTQRRVAGSIAQAIPQESCKERRVEHGAPQALVRFQERTASYGEEEGCATFQAQTVHPGY